MATTELKILLSISGKMVQREVTTMETKFDEWEANLWGCSDDWEHIVTCPMGWEPTGNWSCSWIKNNGGSVTHIGYDNGYKFNVHIGLRFGSGTGYAVGSLYGEFSRNILVTQIITIPKTITLEKTKGNYSLLLDCSDLVSTSWYDIKTLATASTGDTKILFKLTNSATDPNATAEGNYLWVKYSDTEAPSILNIRPLDTEVLRSPKLEISADFSDGSGSGIDLSAFQLYINRGTADEVFLDRNTEKNKGLIKLSENGFLYSSIAPFKSQIHNLFIRIVDMHGNVTEKMSSFRVDIKSFNTNIGSLPVISLSGIGAANAAQLTSIGILTIGDLVNRDAAQLKIDSGLSLKFCTTEIQRARIACTEIRFIKGQFEELYSFTMNTIMAMTNNQLTALDIGTEDWQEIENIRKSIGLLYICLDAPLVDAMTFGQLIWDQI